MPHRSNANGFTLAELMVAMAIAAILLLVSVNSFSNLQARERSRQAVATFTDLFQFARTIAVNYQAPTTVCALDADKACTRDWGGQDPIAVFLDNNNDHRLDASDNLVRQLDWPAQRGKVRWRASLGRKYITFQAMGNTWQNGSVRYCPPDGDPRFARALVVNHAGRPYPTDDADGDGIDEDNYGKNLKCDW